MPEAMNTIQRKAADQAMVCVHENDREWEMLRFPGQHSKMLFHPSAERPTDPNAGFVRYEPGAHHPIHRHDFAQVWYILEGEFEIGGEIEERDGAARPAFPTSSRARATGSKASSSPRSPARRASDFQDCRESRFFRVLRSMSPMA